HLAHRLPFGIPFGRCQRRQIDPHDAVLDRGLAYAVDENVRDHYRSPVLLEEARRLGRRACCQWLWALTSDRWGVGLSQDGAVVIVFIQAAMKLGAGQVDTGIWLLPLCVAGLDRRCRSQVIRD